MFIFLKYLTIFPLRNFILKPNVLVRVFDNLIKFFLINYSYCQSLMDRIPAAVTSAPAPGPRIMIGFCL